MISALPPFSSLSVQPQELLSTQRLVVDSSGEEARDMADLSRIAMAMVVDGWVYLDVRCIFFF